MLGSLEYRILHHVFETFIMIYTTLQLFLFHMISNLAEVRNLEFLHILILRTNAVTVKYLSTLNFGILTT